MKLNTLSLFILLWGLMMISTAVYADILEPYSSASKEAIEVVQKAYLAYYGRPGDPAGIDYWAVRLDAVGGVWNAEILEAFGQSEEFQSRFGLLSGSELISNTYRQLFNREPEPAGLDFFMGLLSSGQSSLSQITVDILNGALGEDKLAINNKLLVCQYYTQVVADGMNYGSIESAVSILTDVTLESGSVSVAYAKIDALALPVSPTPTPTPMPTPTQVPNDAPTSPGEPVHTPVPTTTPIPTITPVPTATPVVVYFQLF